MKTIAELAPESGVHRTTLNKWANKILATNPEVTFIRRSGSVLLIDEESEQFKQWLAGAKMGRPRKAKMKEIKFTDIPIANRPASQNVWQVIIEQASQGLAVILQDGESYAVRFPDEAEPTPFDQLAYNSEIGLYDKRQFPNI